MFYTKLYLRAEIVIVSYTAVGGCYQSMHERLRCISTSLARQSALLTLEARQTAAITLCHRLRVLLHWRTKASPDCGSSGCPSGLNSSDTVLASPMPPPQQKLDAIICGANVIHAMESASMAVSP